MSASYQSLHVYRDIKNKREKASYLHSFLSLLQNLQYPGCSAPDEFTTIVTHWPTERKPATCRVFYILAKS